MRINDNKKLICLLLTHPSLLYCPWSHGLVLTVLSILNFSDVLHHHHDCTLHYHDGCTPHHHDGCTSTGYDDLCSVNFSNSTSEYNCTALGISASTSFDLAHELIDGLVSYTRRLLETIQRAFKLPNMIWLVGYDEDLRLHHVDHFVDMAIKKVVCTSIWWSTSLCCTARIKMIRIDVNLDASANVT